MAFKPAKVFAKEKSSRSFNRRSSLRHLAKHTTRHNANTSTSPLSFPPNAKRTKTMKEKTYRRTLAYTRAGRHTLRRVPWPSILPMKARITLHCHCSFIYAPRFPTNCKAKMTQKHPCTPPPKARQCAFRCIARPSVRQLIGAGTLPPPVH